MLKVGFTGTREGMNAAQRRQCYAVLRSLMHNRTMSYEFHYGVHDAVSLEADREAAEYAEELGYETISYGARAGGELARNRKLVAAVDMLIAAPLTDREEVRSGTWATVRYAREKEIPVIMLSRGVKPARKRPDVSRRKFSPKHP